MVTLWVPSGACRSGAIVRTSWLATPGSTCADGGVVEVSGAVMTAWTGAVVGVAASAVFTLPAALAVLKD
jgi:hypothetical protein